MPKTLKEILNSVGVENKFNKVLQKPKTYNRVKDNIPLVKNYNAMCDLLFLPTAKNYKYLFVIVDLATNLFDIEQLKTKNPDEILKAMKKCFTREYVKKPEYTIKTDSGNEFKGVFQKYLYDESIFHKVAPANHHEGMGNIDNLCKQIGRIIMAYLNKKELETKKKYNDWLPIVPIIRKELNEYRDNSKNLPKKLNSYEYPTPNDTIEYSIKKKDEILTFHKPIKSKFKIGDWVYHYLDHPENALGKKQNTKQRRAGDFNFSRTPLQIEKIFVYGSKGPLYRYKLNSINNVSFTEKQLMKAPNPNN